MILSQELQLIYTQMKLALEVYNYPFKVKNHNVSLKKSECRNMSKITVKTKIKTIYICIYLI